jgi:hypothetical protein
MAARPRRIKMDTIDFCLDMPLPPESQRQMMTDGFEQLGKVAGAIKVFTFTNSQTHLWTVTFCFDDVDRVAKFAVQMEELLGKPISSAGPKPVEN